jgi:hypothetical protein
MQSLSNPSIPSAAPRRGRRRLGISAAVLGLMLGLSACIPGVPNTDWVPDFDNNGKISEDEVNRQAEFLIGILDQIIEQDRREIQHHPRLACLRHRESDRGSWPHTNGYTAQNPASTASGAYQFLNGTWRKASAAAGFGGYSRAMHAPWWIQDAVAYDLLIAKGGASHWSYAC